MLGREGAPQPIVAGAKGRHIPRVRPQPASPSQDQPHLSYPQPPQNQHRPCEQLAPYTHLHHQRAEWVRTHPAHTTHIPLPRPAHMSHTPTSLTANKHLPTQVTQTQDKPLTHSCHPLSLSHTHAWLVHTHSPHTAGTARAHSAPSACTHFPCLAACRTASTPTHQWVLVLLCHQLPLGRLLLGRRQRHRVLLHLTSHPPPIFLAPCPQPTRPHQLLCRLRS